MFTQDFDLFQPATQIPGALDPRRAPSLDSTLPPSFNPAHAAEAHGNVNLYSGQQTVNSTQQHIQRSITRPQVPIFHSNNSTGSLANTNNFNQYQQVTDQTTFEMGGGGNSDITSPVQLLALTMFPDVNVAYDGTFGDLSATGDGLFHDSFDFNQYMGPSDGFTAINGSAGGVTVSPRDIFNNDSVPPSTSFTNLTTPGSAYLETPDEEYQTSPLITDNLGADHGADSWYSLFPDDYTPAPGMIRTVSSSSASQVVVHPGGEGHRKRGSSILASPTPFSPAIKHSNVAGVNARKRDKPLPPIIVDEQDTVALKRARNTAAARKSRAKKVHERDDLEAKIADLEQQVEHWKSIALGGVATDSSEE